MVSKPIFALHGIQWLVLTALLAFYAIAIGRFFDFSDEAIHLYLINEWREASSPAPYYIFFGWFSKIFPFDTLYGLRLMTPALLLGSSLYMALGLGHYLQSIDLAQKKSAFTKGLAFWPYMAISSFVYFCLVAAVSYDTLSTMAAFVWTGSLLWILSYAPALKIAAPALIAGNAAALFMAVYSRPSFGILLILSNLVCALVVQKMTDIRALRPILIATSVFTVIFGISLLLNWDIIQRVISLYPSHAQTSHQGVVAKAFSDLSHLLGRYVPLSAAICAVLYLARKYKPSLFNAGLVLVAIYMLIKVFRAIESPWGHGMTMRLANPVIMSACLVVTWQILTTIAARDWQNLNARRNILLALACLGVACICGIGTNSSIYTNMLYVTPVLLLPLVLVIRARPVLYLALVGLLTLVSGTYIYKNIYANYFRNGDGALQTAHADAFPRLSGLKIEPALHGALLRLKNALDDQGFDREQDKILAWPDLPGFLSALDYRAFGNAWFYTSYENMYKVNCAYIALEPVGPIRNVYVISDGHIDPPFQECAFANLKPASGRAMISVPLGTINHYRNENTSTLTLTGPYSFEKPDAKAGNSLQENNRGK